MSNSVKEIDSLKAELAQEQTLRRRAEKDLVEARTVSDQRGRELAALMRGSKSVLELKEFPVIARSIFDYCRELIGATSGYVALLSADGHENEVLFLEAGGLPCAVDPSLPMPIRGLRAEAYANNKAVYNNDFMSSDWVDFMPAGHVALTNVLFAPLVIDEKTVGIMGLANKQGPFTDNDARLATEFGKLAAIALQNSHNLEKRNAAEAEQKRLITELQAALVKVKKLSGLLPICSVCKKVRDDKGYWNQIEAYISEHSEAAFSHGICKECAGIYYAEYKLYDE